MKTDVYVKRKILPHTEKQNGANASKSHQKHTPSRNAHCHKANDEKEEKNGKH